QAVVFQDDIERLVPRHIVQHDGQRTPYIRVEDDVQAADLVNEAEEVLEINVLQVYRNRLPRVLGAGNGRLRLGLLLRRQVDSWLDRGSCGLAGGRLRLRALCRAYRRQQIAFRPLHKFRCGGRGADRRVCRGGVLLRRIRWLDDYKVLGSSCGGRGLWPRRSRQLGRGCGLRRLCFSLDRRGARVQLESQFLARTGNQLVGGGTL